MKEDFLHFIWKHCLYDKSKLITDNGEQIEVLNPGEQNHDAGPDFFNAKIKSNNTIWVGNVEIHVRSSDWMRHKHDTDKAYDNVILQVVADHDTLVYRTNGQRIPTVELTFNPIIYNNYLHLLQNQEWIPCESRIFRIDPFHLKHWLQNVLVERLEEKSREISSLLQHQKYDWDETFYQQLARNFGFNKNAQPFELLAKSLPYRYLAKHRDNLLQVEAMLFGQAGMLDDLISEDEYYCSLKQEYRFLKEKFSLNPMGGHLWKFLRLRPSNFPTLRIAQFGMLIHQSDRLFSRLLTCKNIKELQVLFTVSASSYWADHYLFHKRSERKKKALGEDAVDVLIINTVVPLLFLYGVEKNLPEYKERALEFLDQIPAEKNSIISKWNALGIKADNAFYSQALLQLKGKYCKFKRCLDCRIGRKIITGSQA
jgi:hypothetical protein